MMLEKIRNVINYSLTIAIVITALIVGGILLVLFFIFSTIVATTILAIIGTILLAIALFVGLVTWADYAG